jgi:hypothetical protein
VGQDQKAKGKKAKGRRGRRGDYTARLVFKGLPRGKLKVSITGTTTRGKKKVKRSRTYNLCVKRGQTAD